MTLNTTHSFIFLSAIFIFSSCKKSDSGPGGPAMTITSISPTSGPSSTLDTIVGTNFSTRNSVFINGKSASIVTVSETQLVVKVPPYAGTGKVTIRDSIGSVTGPVFTFTGNTYLVSTFAGRGIPGSAEGTGTAAGFTLPSSIAIDGNDNLYVADLGNDKIRKITPAGVVTTFAGSTSGGSTDATGAAASFNGVFGVAADSNGNVYVGDHGNNKVRKITPAGVVTTFAGSGSAGSTDATGTAASFNGPTAVALDNNGNVFVVDDDGKKIRKITPTGVVSIFAGSGTDGFADGKGTAASFSQLYGICFDAAGNLYATDGGNSTIRKITPDGTVTTIAGKTSDFGYSDGIGLSAVFNGPLSMAIDANGFMYVVDGTNHVIRQITPEGAVTLLAGVVGSPGTDDGPAAKAKFNIPRGVAFDSHGDIFVTDESNNTIRKLTPQ